MYDNTIYPARQNNSDAVMYYGEQSVCQENRVPKIAAFQTNA